MKQQLFTKLALSILLICCFAWTVQAQKTDARPAPPTKELVQQHAQKMAAELHLSPEQTAQLVKLETTFFEKRKNLHESMAKAEKGKMDALHQSQEASVKKILTTEQYAQYQKKMAAHHKSHPHPPHPHGGH